MAILPDYNIKRSTAGGSPAKSPGTERRSMRRCKITQLMHIRPSDPQKVQFEDLRATLSVSPTGVYFQTTESAYEVGMRLFVAMPYSKGSSTRPREYLGEVVRKHTLSNGMLGIGFKILGEIGPPHSYSFGPMMHIE